MTLDELCQPVFSCLCRYHRIARQDSGVDLDYQTVRQDITNTFQLIREKALAEPALSDQLQRVELPLMFFVDYIIKEGPFAFSAQWEELAHQKNELAGDEKFFDLLDETLNDPSEAATERLKIFSACMALGFNGCYSNDIPTVERKLRVCALRTGVSPNTPFTEPLGEDAYQDVMAEQQFVVPTQKWVRVSVYAALLFAAVIFANIHFYYRATNRLRGDLQEIRDRAVQLGQTAEGQTDLGHAPAKSKTATPPAGAKSPSKQTRSATP